MMIECRTTVVLRAPYAADRCAGTAIGAVAAGFAIGVIRRGTATSGNLATGTASFGIETGIAGASNCARTVAVIIVAYGSASAAIPSRANQNRWRREPRPLSPNVPDVPKLAAPPTAGARRPRTALVIELPDRNARQLESPSAWALPRSASQLGSSHP
jgi:hypothetical protein